MITMCLYCPPGPCEAYKYTLTDVVLVPHFSLSLSSFSLSFYLPSYERHPPSQELQHRILFSHSIVSQQSLKEFHY